MIFRYMQDNNLQSYSQPSNPVWPYHFCRECRFYMKITENSGECRLGPPQVVFTGRDGYNGPEFESLWPQVGQWGWCGSIAPLSTDKDFEPIICS